MLAYGGGSIKRNGIYDEVVSILQAEGKTVIEFPGIMANPMLTKVQEGARLARENKVDMILGVGGGPGWTATQYTDHIAAIVAIEPGGVPAAVSEDYKAVTEKTFLSLSVLAIT